MKDSLWVRDTINLYEYTIGHDHNFGMDLPYDSNMDIYMIGNIIFFCYIVYIKLR